MNVAFAYATQPRRDGENQDAHGVFQFGGLTLAVVCDGVGGHSGGQQAAQLAVVTVAEAMRDVTGGDLSAALHEAVVMANRSLYETGRKSHRLTGMTTTLVAAAIRDGETVIAHVGDSRAYLIRGGQARPLTRDHTMVNMFVDNDLLSPEDAASHPEAHVLSRSLGEERQVEVDLAHAPTLGLGDVLILCTDGLYGAVDEAGLAAGDWQRPTDAAQHLLRRAVSHGLSDNATIVGIRFGSGEPGMDPTPMAVLETANDALTYSSNDWGLDSALDNNEPLPPALYPIEPEDEPTAHDSEADRLLEPQDQDHVSPHQTGTPLPPRVMSRTPDPTEAPRPEPRRKRAPNNRRRLAIAIGVGAIGLSVLIVAGAFLARPLLQGRQGPGPTVPGFDAGSPDAVAETSDTDAAPDGRIAIAVDGSGDDAPSLTPEPHAALGTPEPPVPPTADGVDIAKRPDQFIRVRLTDLSYDSKTMPTKYTEPPPNQATAEQITSLIGTTSPGQTPCAAAVDRLDAVLRKESSGYAPMWRGIWYCFEDHNYRPLSDSLRDGLTLPGSILDLEPYYAGNPVDSAAGRRPYWILPATDGLERRLDLWDDHSRGAGLFDEVVRDDVRMSTIAAAFHHDLMLEAAAALAFSGLGGLPDLPDSQVRVWARRVYTVRRHLDSEVGDLVGTHAPQARTRVGQVLRAATFDFEKAFRAELSDLRSEDPSADTSDVDWRALADARNLPHPVAQALLVAAGEIPPPTAKKPEAEAPKKRKAPRHFLQSPNHLIGLGDKPTP